jgi:hypothetical protein
MEAMYEKRNLHFPGSGADHGARNRCSTDAGGHGRGPHDGGPADDVRTAYDGARHDEQYGNDVRHDVGQGHMTPKQQGQMLEMMHQMGGIMQEMGMPKKGQMAGQHNKQLKEMRKQLDEMKKHMK